MLAKKKCCFTISDFVISHLSISKLKHSFIFYGCLMHLRLPELNIPTLVGSLMEVVVLASMVSQQVHLADCTLAGVGPESPLDQHLNSHVVGLSS